MKWLWQGLPFSPNLSLSLSCLGGYLLAMSASAGEIARVEPFDVIELDIGDMFGLPPREP